jgi:hypothetical protein
MPRKIVSLVAGIFLLVTVAGCHHVHGHYHTSWGPFWIEVDNHQASAIEIEVEDRGWRHVAVVRGYDDVALLLDWDLEGARLRAYDADDFLIDETIAYDGLVWVIR